MTIARLRRGAVSYWQTARKLNRNIQLLLVATALGGIAQGIFSVDFNLYILSLGIDADALGSILSAGLLAHMLGSIPMGFLGEIFGYRAAFLAIYATAGIARLAQVATAHVPSILTAAFVGGLVLAGNFVVRLPFLAANAEDSNRAHAFSLSLMTSTVSFSLGSLIAGYLPNLLLWISPDLTTRYRFSMYLGGALTLIAVIPILMIKDRVPRRKKRISLYPYLHGVDRFTVLVAIIELFIGLAMGLSNPFINVHFVYGLGTTREFFGTVAALAIIPITIATALGPSLGARAGKVRTITVARFLVPVALVTLAITTNPLLGTAAYWLTRAIYYMAQSMWFAFTMEAATPRAKVAVAAWLELTFCLGMAIGSRLTGSLLAASNYALPFYLSAGAAALTGALTYLFVGSYDRREGAKVSAAT